MSLIALKRKYQEIKKNNNINNASVAPSSSNAIRSMINTRGNSKNFFIVPETSSSDKTKKTKSAVLYADENCDISGSTVTPPDSCNIFNDRSISKSSDYIERRKQGCLRAETKPRIHPSCS